jgi:hypothetical protein
MRRVRGVTLIELLLAIVLLSGVAGMIGHFFPSAFRSLYGEKRRTVAKHLAASRMEDAKQRPFLYITPTPDGPYFPVANTCDCRNINFADPAMPFQTVVVDSMTYTRRTCINLLDRVGGAWTPSCPTGGLGPPYKLIRVRVSWDDRGERKNVELESIVSEASS